MGMYDSFYFEKGILPDNKVSEDCEFQSKCLDCILDTYNVDSEGNISTERTSFDDEHLGYKCQEYKIVIANNKIIFVEKVYERGYTEGEESNV
jgi:hypothetical protein